MRNKIETKRNFTLRVRNQDKEVSYIKTHSIRRFLPKTRLINWENKTLDVYLRVSYGKGFFNSGTYNNKKDFEMALAAFLEE